MCPETYSTGQRPSFFGECFDAPAGPQTAASSSASKSRKLTVFVLTVTALWCAYWFMHTRGYWEDDAWIHLEYARSVAEGRGFAFNGITISADTSPLWVLLLAAAHTLVSDWIAAGKLLSAVGALFGFSGVLAVSRRLAHEIVPQISADVFAAAVVLMTAANPYTCYWIFSGMEALTAAGVVCWSLFACMQERPTPGVCLAGCALAGAAPLLRPEMLILSLLLGGFLLRQIRRVHAKGRRRKIIVAAALALLVLPLCLWSLYSLHAFGHLLPTTMAAKRDFTNTPVLKRLWQVYLFGLPLIPVGLLLSLFRLKRWQLLPPAAWLLLVSTGSSIAFYIANHTYVQTRYVLVSAPALMAVTCAMLFAAFPRAGRTMYALALALSVATSVLLVRPFLHNKALDGRASAEMAAYIREHVSPDAPVAIYSIGEIAFLSRHPIVDTGGITRPSALPYLNRPREEVVRWSESEGAQYAIDGPTPEPGALALYTVWLPYASWDVHLGRYKTSEPLTLWRLPPHNASDEVEAAVTQPK